MSSFLLSLAAAAGFASAAQAEKVISINFCQVSSADMRIASDAVVATPVGTIPGSAWAQSTQNGATSAYTFTGSKECVVTDGIGVAQDLAPTFSVSEYMVNMGNHGQITTSSGANMSPVLKSWLGFKNPSDLTKKSSQVVVSNIPYAMYDAIVIMSGYTSTHYCSGVTQSQVQGTDFPAVTVNETAYTYSNGATVAGSGSWGVRGNDAIAVGTNALRINGLSGNLTLDLNAADFGIAGVQIIESTTGHFDIEEYAKTHNDGYVRDGVTYNYIFRGTDATYPNNWGTCSNWYTRVAPNANLGIEEEFWSPYASFTSVSSKNAPLVGSYGGNNSQYAGTGDDRKNESPYDPALVDGSLIANFDPDTPIIMSFCEGWAVKMGVYGGAKLEINRIDKLQSDSGTKWFHIGKGSKITVKKMGSSGTCNNEVKFYIAEREGFVWDCSLSSSNFGNGRYEYYLTGDGSIKFNEGIDRGTHRIMAFEINLSEAADHKKIVIKQLVSVGEGKTMDASKFALSGNLNVTVNGAPAGATPGKKDAIALSDDVGTYSYYQDSTGAYVSYVDYSDSDVVVNLSDGDTYEISQALEGAIPLVCEGSITITGTETYTATDIDFAKLDLSGVTGTVTLGAYTCYSLGTSRTLPEGYVFGNGSAVAMTETIAEYMQDHFVATGLTGVSKVVLTRYDGTIANLGVTDGVASRGDGTDVKVTGAAALYDFTFTNTLKTATGSRIEATMSKDANPQYEESSDGVGVGATAYPWISLNSRLPTWSEFTTAVVGKMPSNAQKTFVSFGSGNQKVLFLATGSKANEVVVGYGNSSSSEVLTTMTVPNAATARHVYTFVVSEGRTKLTIYLDGMKWKTVEKATGFTFGTTSDSGIQIGKGFGANPRNYGSSSDGVFYALLIYDYILSESQIDALKELYPYNSPQGSYERSVSGATEFASEDSWSKVGGSALYSVPADGAAVSLTSLTDAEVEVNATLEVESLSLEGDGAIALKKGDGLLTSAGLTTIATDVTIEAGAADISGAPTVITEGASLRFDYTKYDLFAYTGTSLVPLTGEVEEQGQGVVTCKLPAGDFTREHTSEFLYTNGCYQLLVTSREGRDVYLPAGTTNFADDTHVKYFVEVPVDPEVQGDPEIVTNECYAIAADTVHFSDIDTVAVARTCPVAGYDFGDYAGKLVFAPGQEELVLSTAITGSGKVEVSSGVVQSRGSIATDIDVASGALLKLGSVGGFGATGGGTTPSGKAITVAGTVELNGVRDSCNAFTLAGGGKLQNTGADIGNSYRQTMGLTLSGDATVHATHDFGLINSGNTQTSLNLDGHKLTKTGDAKFWLYNTTITGSGIIDIQAGSVDVYNTLTAADATFNVGANGALKIRTSDFSAKAISGTGTVSIGQDRANPMPTLNFAAGSSLAVEIVLANTTESLIEIPYTGPKPRALTVYGTDWETPDSAATATAENGKIVVQVEIANTRRANPAKDGDWATFTNVFRGTEDATWETVGDWYVVNNNRWSSYAGEIAPAKTGSNQWEPILIDGAYVKLAPGQDGYKEVASEALEGWNLRLGLYNGVRVTIGSLIKVQSGDGVSSIFMVDDSSQLVVTGRGNGNNGGDVNFYVAAKDGITFKTDFVFNKSGANTVYYSLAGEGSVKYEAGVTTGTHNIKRVKLPVGSPQSKLKKLIKRRLVSFGSKTSGNVAFGLGNAEVTSADTTLTMEKFTPPEETPDAKLTTAEPFGKYQLTQEKDGVYITYVGYAVPFRLYLR